MTRDPFAGDPILAALNLLIEPAQEYKVAGRGTDAERAAIMPLKEAAQDLVDACTEVLGTLWTPY